MRREQVSDCNQSDLAELSKKSGATPNYEEPEFKNKGVPFARNVLVF
jgi:hypothetical protein